MRKLPQSVSDEGRYRAARVAKKIKYSDNIELLLYSGASLGLSRYRLLISAFQHSLHEMQEIKNGDK